MNLNPSITPPFPGARVRDPQHGNRLANAEIFQPTPLAINMLRVTDPRSAARTTAAFSLLEVMVAIAIFFAAAFAILNLVSGGLRNARMLQRPQVDAAAVASVLSTTNKIVEGTESGDLSDLLGDTYRGYTWESTSIEVQSNKLFQVDFTIYGPASGHPVFSKISTRLYRPESLPGSLDGGMGLH